MQPLNILVVDDNRTSADALARVLTSAGDTINVAYDGGTAIEQLQNNRFDVVLTDLKMEPVDGLSVLKEARHQRPPAEVIVFTAYGAIEAAVEAMRLGARDFLTKPVTVDQIAHRLDQLRTEGQAVADREEDLVPLVTQSPAAAQFARQIERCAATKAPIWLEGELGTGRSYAARHIHVRANNSEPFSVQQIGRVGEWPDRGTVVLPNVDSLPLDLQKQLLRLLEFVPPGVRIISTASPNSKNKVQAGVLLSDLYYALAVVIVQVPPLRERREDVEPLFRQALAARSEQYLRPIPALSTHQVDLLEQHSWPGNIRELNNLAERAIIMGTETLTFRPKPIHDSDIPELSPGFSLADHLEQIERKILTKALRQAGDDRALVGRLLGVERNTLRYKLNKYGLLNRS
jgi:DNA-binding NtrC family response regulator